ncbi:hypothetical protein J6590_092086, partial [Homalodisca vitripennis]
MKHCLILNLGSNNEPPMDRTCKDRIAQRSPIQAAATLDVALLGYLAITAVPTTLRHGLHVSGKSE